MNRFTKISIVLCVMLVLFSCEKAQHTTDFKVESVQIRTLRLSSNDIPELGDVFFSIDHAKGEVYNAKPMPYRSHFKMAKLLVDTDAKNDIHIFVNNEERSFNAKDSIDFSGWDKGVRIEISNKEKTLSKSYNLHIRCYASDPLSFNWAEATVQGLPAPGSYQSRRVITDKRYVYMVYDEQDVYMASKEKPLEWSNIGHFSQPSTLPIQVVAAPAKSKFSDIIYLFALTPTDGFVALVKSLKGDKFFTYKVPVSTKILAFLGAFTQDFDEDNASVALITELKDGWYAFAKKTVFVNEKWHGQFVEYRGEQAPKVFATDFKGLPAILQSSKANYDRVEIFVPMEGYPDKVQLWSTTTGKDWLTVPPTSLSKALPLPIDHPAVLAYDADEERYILIDVKGQHKCYYSFNGYDWEKADDEILLPKDPHFRQVDADFVGFGIDDHRIVLLPNNSDKARIGIPAMYEEN